MNIFPKRQQTMLIPRDFTLNSKAFSKIWDDKGHWKLAFLFPVSCKSSPWDVLQALFWTHKALGGLVSVGRYPAFPCLFTLLCPLHSGHTSFLIPSCIQSVPPTSGPFHMLFTLPGMPVLLPFHPVKSPKNSTQKLVSRKISLISLMWKCTCVCVCVCFCRVCGWKE